MKTGLLLFILWSKILFCFAQKAPEKIIYQLAGSILDEQRQEKIKRFKEQIKHGRIPWPDGPYNPADTLLKSQLLLDHIFSNTLAYEHLPQIDSKVLTNYLSVSDINYMRQQIARADSFRFDQYEILLDNVKILPLDDLVELRKDLTLHNKEYLWWDSVTQKYGSDFYSVIGISRPLFSLNNKYAIVSISRGSRSDLCLYKRVGNRWYRIEEVETIIYD